MTSAFSLPAFGSAGAMTLIERQYVPAAINLITIGVPSSYKQVMVQWMARHNTAGTAYALWMRVNGDSTASYHGGYMTQVGGATTPSSATAGAQAQARIGAFGGVASAASTGNTSGGIVHLHSWNTGAGSLGRLHFTYQSTYYENGTFAYYENGGHMYNVAPPYTSLNFLCATPGQLQAGSEFTVWGLN